MNRGRFRLILLFLALHRFQMRGIAAGTYSDGRINFHMLNRRGALVAIGIAAFGGVEWCISKGRQVSRLTGERKSFTAFGAELPNTADDNLHADLARMGSRVYSEEGVAMFLACVNVPAVGTSPEQAPAASAMNQKVASAFHRYAEEWQHMRPDAPPNDTAKILELLANRDFANGGTEASL